MRTSARKNDLATWRRCRVILDFYNGISVIQLAKTINMVRSTIYEWIKRFESEGVNGLISKKQPGAPPRLSLTQIDELTSAIEMGPNVCGYSSGIWTGPMIGDLIFNKFKVRYHNNYIPSLLHRLGFSVQKPKKKLAKADKEKQAYWLQIKFPEIKKKPIKLQA